MNGHCQANHGVGEAAVCVRATGKREGRSAPEECVRFIIRSVAWHTTSAALGLALNCRPDGILVTAQGARHFHETLCVCAPKVALAGVFKASLWAMPEAPRARRCGRHRSPPVRKAGARGARHTLLYVLHAAAPRSFKWNVMPHSSRLCGGCCPADRLAALCELHVSANWWPRHDSGRV